jgi:hypothetical protein
LSRPPDKEKCGTTKNVPFLQGWTIKKYDHGKEEALEKK